MTMEHPAPPLTDSESAAASSVFGERSDLAVAYADLLCGTGVTHGLVGPREVERIWGRHLLNCGVLAELIATDAKVADVGSGAGLPGLVLAVARPDLQVTLIEPLLRRTVWLEAAAAELGLENVEVRRGRAEETRPLAAFDVVTSRAVSALPKLGRWCLPLVVPGGTMLAIKGRSAAEELAASESTLRSIGASACDVAVLGEGFLDEPTTVIRIVKGPGSTKARRRG